MAVGGYGIGRWYLKFQNKNGFKQALTFGRRMGRCATGLREEGVYYSMMLEHCATQTINDTFLYVSHN